MGFGMAIGVMVCGPAIEAALHSLRPATVQAFGHYLAYVESDNARTLREGPFLCIDGLSGTERTEALANLKAGQVQMRRLSTKASGRDPDVPGGMIHDWQGIIFIPGAKLDDVLRVLENYNQHAAHFAPDVEKSYIESQDGAHYRVFMRFRRQKLVTVVLDTDQDIHYFHDSTTRAHSRSSAVRIAQVENPGEPDEREKPPGSDDGFLWRMETWWRMEERDGGVYVQNEAVTLTRDVPAGLGWLIEPFIINIPKETLDFTLQALRKAVLNHSR
jgi:hypothetical protein